MIALTVMRRYRIAASAFLLLVCRAQQSVEAQSSSSLLVDVMVTDKRANAPAEGLTQDDFEIFDGRSRVPIASLAHAPDLPPRPLVIWFAVQCPLKGFAGAPSWASYGSGFVRGKTASFTPVLQKLREKDMVAVTHWCDDGTFGVDLLPTTDRNAPSASLEKVLAAPMSQPTNEPGMNALHDLILRVRDASQRATPGALPALIFLYGDHGGMYAEMAKDVLERPLGPLPLIYGINNGVLSVQKRQFTPPGYYYIVHYLSDRTGGVVLSSWHGNYDVDLDHILTELEGRYQLGFIPGALDGKQHELNIKLSEGAKSKLTSVDLRYAPYFLASPSAVLSAPSPKSQAEAALSLALGNGAPYTEIAFDASGKSPGPGQSAQFRLYIGPRSLSWSALENGDRRAILTLAIAAISAQGVILGQQLNQFEARQTRADQSGTAPKAVILGVPFLPPKDTDHVRFVLQDSSSGRLGSFDLPASRIGGFVASAPPS